MPPQAYGFPFCFQAKWSAFSATGSVEVPGASRSAAASFCTCAVIALTAARCAFCFGVRPGDFVGEGVGAGLAVGEAEGLGVGDGDVVGVGEADGDGDAQTIAVRDFVLDGPGGFGGEIQGHLDLIRFTPIGMIRDHFKVEVTRCIHGKRIARDQAYFWATRICGEGFQNVE